MGPGHRRLYLASHRWSNLMAGVSFLLLSASQRLVYQRSLFSNRELVVEGPFRALDDKKKEEQPLLALAHAWSLRSPPQACDSKAVTGCSPEAGL